MLIIPERFSKRKAGIVGTAALAVGFFSSLAVLGAINNPTSPMAAFLNENSFTRATLTSAEVKKSQNTSTQKKDEDSRSNSQKPGVLGTQADWTKTSQQQPTTSSQEPAAMNQQGGTSSTTQTTSGSTTIIVEVPTVPTTPEILPPPLPL